MKKAICMVLTVVSISTAIIGCKKNDNGNGSWSATVNGSAVSGNFVNATYFSANQKLIVTLTPTITNSYPSIAIQGITDSAGTINLNGSNSFTATFTDSAGATIYSTASGGSGQFIIGTLTPLSSQKISANFNFIAHNPANAADSVIIANGMFSNIGLMVQ